jgi:hypothetical protein
MYIYDLRNRHVASVLVEPHVLMQFAREHVHYVVRKLCMYCRVEFDRGARLGSKLSGILRL